MLDAPFSRVERSKGNELGSFSLNCVRLYLCSLAAFAWQEGDEASSRPRSLACQLQLGNAGASQKVENGLFSDVPQTHPPPAPLPDPAPALHTTTSERSASDASDASDWSAVAWPRGMVMASLGGLRGEDQRCPLSLPSFPRRVYVRCRHACSAPEDEKQGSAQVRVDTALFLVGY